MFEDSTFESMRRIHTRSRRWMIATFTFNGAILAALVLIPLFHPEALSSKAISMLISAPPTPVEEPKPIERPAHAAPAQREITDTGIQAPSTIPIHIYVPKQREDWAPINVGDLAESSGPVTLHGANVHNDVVQGTAGPKAISSVLAEGLLIRKVIPRYPAIAIAVRAEGTVELQATISKNGTIENLRVMSGPAMLQQAALDAVAQWRYRPYLLNGQPVEVETTVNVEFKLN
jgi:periplasmic protein TonB